MNEEEIVYIEKDVINYLIKKYGNFNADVLIKLGVLLIGDSVSNVYDEKKGEEFENNLVDFINNEYEKLEVD